MSARRANRHAPDAASSEGPVRTCLSCRGRAPRDALVRLVVVDGAVVVDPRRRLPGRGASIHPDCLTALDARGAAQVRRALRAPDAVVVDLATADGGEAARSPRGG